VRWPNLSFAISDHLEVSARPNTSAESDTEAASPYNDRHRQQSRRNAKKTENHCERSRRLCVSIIPFPSRGTPRVEKHHAPTAAIKRSRVSENQVVLSANLERSGVVVTVKATTVSGASACPSQSDFDTRLVPIIAPSRRSACGLRCHLLDDFGRSTIAVSHALG
jgi:hypothetical protein